MAATTTTTTFNTQDVTLVRQRELAREAQLNYVPSFGQLYGTVRTNLYDCLQVQIAKAEEVYAKNKQYLSNSSQPNQVSDLNLYLMLNHSKENIVGDVEFYRKRVISIGQDPHEKTCAEEPIAEQTLGSLLNTKSLPVALAEFGQMVDKLEAYEKVFNVKFVR